MGDEVFHVLLVSPHLPELRMATSVGVLRSKYGSRSGAVTPEQRTGPVAHSLQLLCGGPCTEILGSFDIQGLCSFPFLECVIFPPFARIQEGRTGLSRELLTLCSNQK